MRYLVNFLCSNALFLLLISIDIIFIIIYLMEKSDIQSLSGTLPDHRLSHVNDYTSNVL